MLSLEKFLDHRDRDCLKLFKCVSGHEFGVAEFGNDCGLSLEARLAAERPRNLRSQLFGDHVIAFRRQMLAVGLMRQPLEYIVSSMITGTPLALRRL